MGGTFESRVAAQLRPFESGFNDEGQEVLSWYRPANSLIPVFNSSGPL